MIGPRLVVGSISDSFDWAGSLIAVKLCKMQTDFSEQIQNCDTRLAYPLVGALPCLIA